MISCSIFSGCQPLNVHFIFEFWPQNIITWCNLKSSSGKSCSNFEIAVWKPAWVRSAISSFGKLQNDSPKLQWPTIMSLYDSVHSSLFGSSFMWPVWVYRIRNVSIITDFYCTCIKLLDESVPNFGWIQRDVLPNIPPFPGREALKTNGRRRTGTFAQARVVLGLKASGLSG